MDKVSHLLLTLPSSYNKVITAIETLAEGNLTLAFVKNRLLNHEIKIKNDSSDTSRKVMKAAVYNNNNYKNRSFKNSNSGIRKPFKGKGKFNIQCHHCGKEGHIKKDCNAIKIIINDKNKENNKQAQIASAQPGFAFMLNRFDKNKSKSDNENVKFILDSGATDHLVNDEKLFVDYIDLESPIKIDVAKHGEFIFATKRGTVRLNNGNQITLEDVLYCQNVAENLISVKRLQEAGMTVMFGSNGVKIFKNGSVVAENSGMFNTPILEFKAYISNAEKNIMNIGYGMRD